MSKAEVIRKLDAYMHDNNKHLHSAKEKNFRGLTGAERFAVSLAVDDAIEKYEQWVKDHEKQDNEKTNER